MVFSFSNCNNRKEPILNLEKNADSKRKTDIVSKIETTDLKTDTLTKKSETFKINDINCYWKYTIIIRSGEKSGISSLTLKNTYTQKTLLSNSDFSGLGLYDGFTENELKENFKDANFDGLQDFVVYSQEESGSGGLFYRVYLFNKSSETFVLSEELSGGEFEINKTDKTVSTYWKMGVGFN